MKFAAPHYLWLLLVVLPLLGAFFFWAWRVKQKLMTQFIPARLLANLTTGLSPARQKFRIGLLIASVGFLLIALARPQWGFVWEEAKQQGLDIVVAIDTSRSMLAEDVAPNRLTRAKLAALDLMKQCKNDRLGLVSFAGTAFLQSPLTLDEEAFRQSVDALTVGIIPQGGTALAAAIDTALTAFEKEGDNHKILVLFTDGEDHDSDTETLEATEKAAKAGMKIFTIGVGTAMGEMLRTKDEQGNTVYIKDDEGNAIKSHLNETLLQKIATAANGFYLPLQGANPMEMLYERGLKPLPKSDSNTKLTKVYRERFHWPLAIAIACLLVETVLPERKKLQRPASAAVPSGTQAKKAVVSLCLLLLPLLAMASPSSALRQYNSGKYEAALDEYERLSERKTNDYRLHYNAGTSAYQAKQLEAAQKHLNAALNSPEITSDLITQQRAYYNLGNTEFQLGAPVPDTKKKKELWEQSIANYTRALQLDPKDTNANNNLAFVKRKLEELKQQQQQQKDNNGDSKDQEDKDQQKDQDQKGEQDKKDQKDQKEQKNQKQDDKQQQQNSQDQKSAKDQEQKKADQEKKKQQQAKKDKEKQEQKDQAAAEEKKEKSPEGSEQQEATVAGQMSLQQAKRILDAQQEDEKALIFRPENDPQKQQSQKLKDW